MTSVDWVVLAILAAFALAGLWRGVLLGLLDLATLVAGAIAAAAFAGSPANLLADWGLSRFTASWLALLAIFAIVVGVLRGVLGWVAGPIRLARWLPPLGCLDRLLGIVPGLVQGAIAIAALVGLQLFGLPRPWVTAEIRRSAVLEPSLARGLETVHAVLIDDLRLDPADIARMRLDPIPSVRSSASGTLTSTDPTTETALLTAINRTRASADLPALAADPRLTTAARAVAAGLVQDGATAVVAVGQRRALAARLAAAGADELAAGQTVIVAADANAATSALAGPAGTTVARSSAYLRAGVGVVRSGAGLIVVLIGAA